MSKIILSPVKRWNGSVTLSDPLTFPQVFAFQAAIREAKAAEDGMFAALAAWLPGILACVEKWGLSNFPEQPTVENWPATPTKSSAELVSWLVGEISALFNEAEPDPNA